MGRNESAYDLWFKVELKRGTLPPKIGKKGTTGQHMEVQRPLWKDHFPVREGLCALPCWLLGAKPGLEGCVFIWSRFPVFGVF